MGTKKQTSPNYASPTYASLAYASPARAPSTLMTTVFAVVIAVGSLALAPAAMAEPDTVRPVSASVSYADLDLSTESGARAMLERVKLAARDMCGTQPIHSPLTPRAPTQFRDCVAEAVDSAVTGLGSPLVLALHKVDTDTAPTTLASR